MSRHEPWVRLQHRLDFSKEALVLSRGRSCSLRSAKSVAALPVDLLQDLLWESDGRLNSHEVIVWKTGSLVKSRAGARSSLVPGTRQDAVFRSGRASPSSIGKVPDTYSHPLE